MGIADKSNDEQLVGLADSLGFPDYATAQRSPVALLGTADEVREELERRSSLSGMRYYILFMATPESQERFAAEVMPAFATV